MKHCMNVEHLLNAKLKQMRVVNVSFEKHMQMLYIAMDLFWKHESRQECVCSLVTFGYLLLLEEIYIFQRFLVDCALVFSV